MFRTFVKIALPLIAVALVAGPALAQPSSSYLLLDGDSGDYVEIPDAPSLDTPGALTVEAWVRLDSSDGCDSLVGKDWEAVWWLGVCTNTFRTYIDGGGALDGGTLPDGVWTHVALAFDGTFHRNYVNGVETASRALAAPVAVNDAAIRIGSDVSWNPAPTGNIDEVRLWNVGRTPAQIQATMNVALTTDQAGLVSVWSLDGNPSDRVGDNDGAVVGDASFEGIPDPPAGPWTTDPAFPDFRFKVLISPGGGVAPILGTREGLCLPETVCFSGALDGRSEVFVRVIGPRPNGFLWPVMTKFTPSVVEVWIEQLSTGDLQYYLLPQRGDELPGLFDRTGFTP